MADPLFADEFAELGQEINALFSRFFALVVAGEADGATTARAELHQALDTFLDKGVAVFKRELIAAAAAPRGPARH